MATLLAAAEAGDLERVQAHIAARADLNARDGNGNSPLAWAAYGGHPEASNPVGGRQGPGGKAWKAALTYYMYARRSAFYSYTGIDAHSCGRSALQVAAALIAAGADIENGDGDDGNNTPLIWACVNGSAPIAGPQVKPTTAHVPANNDIAAILRRM